MRILDIQSSCKTIAIFLIALIVCIPFSFAQVVKGTVEKDFWEGEETDIIINILEQEPTVLRAYTIREINAPIYASLYAVPTTGKGVPRIKSIHIRETDTNWLTSGIGYQAPSFYSWDNLGYFETKLRKIPNFEDIPDTIDVNLVAKIRYEAETTTEFIGAVKQKSLEEKAKVSKDELLYNREYKIFDKGYIVANEVGDEEVTFTIYNSDANKIKTFSLEVGDESGEFGLIRGSRMNEDYVRIRLEGIVDGSKDNAILLVPGYKGQFDEKIVSIGDDVEGWKVKKIDDLINAVFLEKEIDGKNVVIYLFEVKGENIEEIYRSRYTGHVDKYDYEAGIIEREKQIKNYEKRISELNSEIQNLQNDINNADELGLRPGQISEYQSQIFDYETEITNLEYKIKTMSREKVEAIKEGEKDIASLEYYKEQGVDYKSLLQGLDELKEDFGGIISLKEIGKGKPKEAVLVVGGKLDTVWEGAKINDDCTLKKVEPNSVTIEPTKGKPFALKLQTPEERKKKDEAYKEECGGILLKEIHTQNKAQITILTGRKKGETETHFSLHIPVDKGVVRFSDESLTRQINGTQKLIDNINKPIKKLEKIIETWTHVCLATTALLLIVKFFSPASKITGGVISDITGRANTETTDSGVKLDLKSKDDKQLFLEKAHTNSIKYQEGTYNFFAKGERIYQNIYYDDQGDPYYLKSASDGWIRYSGLNVEYSKSIYPARKNQESVLVVPIKDPESELRSESGALRILYDREKEKHALDKGFYVLYYEKSDKIELYQAIDKIDLGGEDDRVITTKKEGAELDDFKASYLSKVNKAQKSGENKVKIGDKEYFIDTSKSFDPSPLTCAKVFCPPGVKMCWQCRLLFNACDPVVCPASRCDMGGRFTIEGGSIADKGLVASLILCLPNIKSKNGGVMMPFCLSGIYAGLKAVESMLVQYKLCLETQKSGNQEFGFCERLQSMSICQIVWREVAGWLMMSESWIGGLLGNPLALLTGGGGEYFTKSTNKRVEESRKAVNFFVQNYAGTLFTKYRGKTTKDIGYEVCKSFVGGKIPSFGEFINQLATPEVAPQFTAHFEEEPYSTIAGTSEYTVYYHVYAGTLIERPRLDYYIYLKKSGERDSKIDRGTLTEEQSHSDTIIKIDKSGYEQICVNLNGKEECNFGKMVSSDWALDFLTDKFVDKQRGKLISSKRQCVSESYGFLGAPVERVCSIDNPGLEKVEQDRWKPVGECGVDERGVNLGQCWMKKTPDEIIAGAEQVAEAVDGGKPKSQAIADVEQEETPAEGGRYYEQFAPEEKDYEAFSKGELWDLWEKEGDYLAKIEIINRLKAEIEELKKEMIPVSGDIPPVVDEEIEVCETPGNLEENIFVCSDVLNFKIPMEDEGGLKEVKVSLKKYDTGTEVFSQTFNLRGETETILGKSIDIKEYDEGLYVLEWTVWDMVGNSNTNKAAIRIKR